MGVPKTGLPLNTVPISLNALETVSEALIVLDRELHATWMNARARLLCPLRLLRDIVAQDGVAALLKRALAGECISPIEDVHGRVGLVVLDRLDSEHLLCGMEDLQVRERLEEEYRRLQKSGSLFLFSQSLGHDLKNRLTGVVGNLNLARVILEEGRPGLEALDIIRDAERAALDADVLIQRFMLFSHNDSQTIQDLDLDALLNNAAALILGGTTQKIQLTMREKPWNLTGNPGQIQQVFQNILQNSADAMPGPGVIHVDMENLRIHADPVPGNREGELIRNGQFEAGDYVSVHIRDGGQGILSRDLPFVFEPFFSRKDSRQGLGLTVALSIVRKHEGFIDVHSQAGRGTTVSVYLPVHSNSTETSREIKPDKAAKILVMDDESMVREVWERLLNRLGHGASFASDGSEAMYLYQTALHSDHPFELVILDLTVPGGMGAIETLEQLRTLDPNVKAVICSGYTQDPLMTNFSEVGFKAALPKPFGLDKLRRLIQDILQ